MCSTDTNKTKGKTQLEGSDQPSLRFCVGGLGNLEWQRCPVECCMGLLATRLDHLRKLCYAQPSSFARNQRDFCRRIIDSPLAVGSMDVWMLSPSQAQARPRSCVAECLSRFICHNRKLCQLFVNGCANFKIHTKTCKGLGAW